MKVLDGIGAGFNHENWGISYTDQVCQKIGHSTTQQVLFKWKKWGGARKCQTNPCGLQETTAAIYEKPIKKKVASFGTTSEGHTLNRPQTHPSKTRRPYQRVLNNHQPLLTVFWSPIVLGIFEPMWQRGNVANDWKKSLPMWCGMDTTGSGEKDIRTYVQKKREVFLVHMACDNKREEAVSWTHWLRKCHVFFFRRKSFKSWITVS